MRWPWVAAAAGALAGAPPVAANTAPLADPTLAAAMPATTVSTASFSRIPCASTSSSNRRTSSSSKVSAIWSPLVVPSKRSRSCGSQASAIRSVSGSSPSGATRSTSNKRSTGPLSARRTSSTSCLETMATRPRTSASGRRLNEADGSASLVHVASSIYRAARDTTLTTTDGQPCLDLPTPRLRNGAALRKINANLRQASARMSSVGDLRHPRRGVRRGAVPGRGARASRVLDSSSAPSSRSAGISARPPAPPWRMCSSPRSNGCASSCASSRYRRV